MASFTQWEILKAWIPSSDGSTPRYPHPCIFLGDSSKFLGKILVLGITSDLTKKTADYSIELPWTPDGKCETGLSKPSIAQVHWTDHIMRDEVRGVIGYTPKRQQLEVARALALRIQRQGQRKT